MDRSSEGHRGNGGWGCTGERCGRGAETCHTVKANVLLAQLALCVVLDPVRLCLSLSHITYFQPLEGVVYVIHVATGELEVETSKLQGIFILCQVVSSINECA